MGTIRIRPYAAADLKACADIFDRAWREGHPFAPRKIDASVLADEIVGETIFVAENESQAVAGFVSIYTPESFIHHLYIDPRLRNRGIGSALLRHAVAVAGGTATLKCQLGNQPALGFYRHLGWTEIVAGTNQYGAWVTLRSPRKTSDALPATGLR